MPFGRRGLKLKSDLSTIEHEMWRKLQLCETRRGNLHGASAGSWAGGIWKIQHQNKLANVCFLVVTKGFLPDPKVY